MTQAQATPEVSYTETPFLYTCYRCKTTRRVSYKTEITTQTIALYERFTPVGEQQKIEKYTTLFVRRYFVDGQWQSRRPSIQCCNLSVLLYQVRVEHSSTIRCGPKCREAKGPECKCSCGGENHGISYA